MFDANLRGLPKGREFFAKVHWCEEGCSLYQVGMRKGDLFRCKMLSDCEEDPEVVFYFGNGVFETSDSKSGKNSFLIYEGNIDGTGFIDEESRVKAMKMLEV